MKSLFEHISGMTAEQLAALVAERSDTYLPASTQDLRRLADRLTQPDTLSSALLGLNLAELEVVEALAAVGSGYPIADLALALDTTEHDAAFVDVLDRLSGLALAWRDGYLIRTAPLSMVVPHPFGLGPSVLQSLDRLNVDQLRMIARKLGITVGRSRDAIVGDLKTWFSDGHSVREAVAGAPDDVQKLLLRLTWEGPELFDPQEVMSFRRGQPVTAQWAIERVMLAMTDWGQTLTLVREVGLALRGSEYRMPFHPTPPEPPTVEVSPAMVDREASAMITAALGRFTSLLDECGRTPVAMLKNGGVGLRELRRLAKTIGGPEDHIRLMLEVSAAARLLAGVEDGMVPTLVYDDWGQLPPPIQFSVLLGAWLQLPGVPLGVAALGGTRPPVFVPNDYDGLGPILRDSLLAMLASLPVGLAVADISAATTLIAWFRPIIGDHVVNLELLVEGVLQEMNLFGIAAHNALSSVGRAFADTDTEPEALTQSLERMLPPAQTKVLLQGDLTAVVTGTPAVTLAGFLDFLADRESRSGAHTWRFSESSVRRAFDAGLTAEQLLARLRELAGDRLPQPLEYLIGDVSRRHGNVRVRSVACCLRSEDTTLLNEILHAKGLAKLGLTALAPTVLASAAPAAETLRALRAAGYAPAGENPDGTVALEPVLRHRAGPAPD